MLTLVNISFGFQPVLSLSEMDEVIAAKVVTLVTTHYTSQNNKQKVLLVHDILNSSLYFAFEPLHAALCSLRPFWAGFILIYYTYPTSFRP